MDIRKVDVSSLTLEEFLKLNESDREYLAFFHPSEFFELTELSMQKQGGKKK